MVRKVVSKVRGKTRSALVDSTPSNHPDFRFTSGLKALPFGSGSCLHRPVRLWVASGKRPVLSPMKTLSQTREKGDVTPPPPPAVDSI